MVTQRLPAWLAEVHGLRGRRSKVPKMRLASELAGGPQDQEGGDRRRRLQIVSWPLARLNSRHRDPKNVLEGKSRDRQPSRPIFDEINELPGLSSADTLTKFRIIEYSSELCQQKRRDDDFEASIEPCSNYFCRCTRRRQQFRYDDIRIEDRAQLRVDPYEKDAALLKREPPLRPRSWSHLPKSYRVNRVRGSVAEPLR